MEKFNRRLKTLAALTGIYVVIIALIFVSKMRAPAVLFWLSLLHSGLVGGAVMIILARECKKSQTARLIVNNSILHICVATTGGGDRPGENEKMEIYISYFGILLDSRIIKYNQECIFLKDVSIEKDFIILSYGTDNWLQKIQILHGTMSNEELNKVAQRFRDETGILPVITL